MDLIDTSDWHAVVVEGQPSEPEPAEIVRYFLEEALDLLAALEDAREALFETDHLAEVVQIEHHIQLLNRRLGFEELGGANE